MFEDRWIDVGTVGAIVDAAVAVGLTAMETRRAVLSGAGQAYFAGLGIVGRESDQLLADLNAMNEVEALVDGTVPLLVWLEAAYLLRKARPEAEVFRRAADRVAGRIAEAHPAVATIFAGREEELAEIEAAILSPAGEAKPVAICALQGMPGVGKSYLADRFGHVHKERFSGGYVKIALSPDVATSVEMLGGELAGRLNQSAWGTEQAWAMLRARMQAPRVLLHIENADGEESKLAAMGLADRLAGCAVIVSGRVQNLGHARRWKQVNVDVFGEKAALRAREWGSQSVSLDAV